MLAELVRWEALLQADLGFGLDLTACAVTGETAGLAYVSPRTGRAVTEAAAGTWTGRLLRFARLPGRSQHQRGGGLAATGLKP